MTIRISPLSLLVVVAFLAGCATQTARVPAATKVILLIGDGMDDQQITIARNYLVGSRGRLTLDKLPYRGAARVQTVAENDPSKPVYVADSANTATAMATGQVTSQGRIATTAQTDRDLATIMELAQAGGLGTGIVTTASLTDATPAAFVAHVNQRFCEGPKGMVRTFGPMNTSVDCSNDYKANGGPGSIAEQIAASDVDVLLGGGLRYFQQMAEGVQDSTVVDVAAANGYQVIGGRGSLAEVMPGSRVLGLFAPGTLPVKMRGEGGAAAMPITKGNGGVRLAEPFVCEPNPDFTQTPTLAQMTQAALRVLDDGRGFMLMIESASIDKQSHYRRPCGHIGEVSQLDETLGAVLVYAADHPETLVLVTADHSHAAQIVSDTGKFLALNFASPGYFARLRTPEGGIMGINYATNDSPIQEYHTGAQVPVFAIGPGSDDLPTFMDQTNIFTIAARHLGLTLPGR